jgi:hypothetical protein
MGKAREQEVRLTMYGLIALMAITALVAVSAAVAFGSHWHLTLPGATSGQDVGGASAPYVQR